MKNICGSFAGSIESEVLPNSTWPGLLLLILFCVSGNVNNIWIYHLAVVIFVHTLSDSVSTCSTITYYQNAWTPPIGISLDLTIVNHSAFHMDVKSFSIDVGWYANIFMCFKQYVDFNGWACLFACESDLLVILVSIYGWWGEIEEDEGKKW